LVGWLVGCGWLVGWLVGWFFGWLVGWLAGWLVCWLVGWINAIQHSKVSPLTSIFWINQYMY